MLFSVRGRGLATKNTVPTTLFLPIHWDPNANHSTITMGGWAGQAPEGRDSTPMPSRKKEKREECHFGSSAALLLGGLFRLLASGGGGAGTGLL